jgi:hypothetical protein
MIDFIIGVVVGAAFAPFWIMLWNLIKKMFTEATSSKDQPK